LSVIRSAGERFVTIYKDIDARRRAQIEMMEAKEQLAPALVKQRMLGSTT